VLHQLEVLRRQGADNKKFVVSVVDKLVLHNPLALLVPVLAASLHWSAAAVVRLQKTAAFVASFALAPYVATRSIVSVMSLRLPAGTFVVAGADIVAAGADIAAVLLMEEAGFAAAEAAPAGAVVVAVGIAFVLVVEVTPIAAAGDVEAAEARIAVAQMLEGAASATKHLEVVDILFFVACFPFDLQSELLHYSNQTVRSPRMPNPKLESARTCSYSYAC
jgi:hypothetical protein